MALGDWRHGVAWPRTCLFATAQFLLYFGLPALMLFAPSPLPCLASCLQVDEPVVWSELANSYLEHAQVGHTEGCQPLHSGC